MKTVLSQSALLAFLFTALAGTVHAADCPDRTGAVSGNQARSTSTPATARAIYSNPWAELIRVQAALEHQFDAMNAPQLMFVPSPAFAMPTPVSSLRRTQDGYRLEIPLPGFKAEDIHVHLDGQLLSIAAETASTTKVGQQDTQSRSSRALAETLTLPGSVKASELKQKFENGVLILTLPEREGST